VIDLPFLHSRYFAVRGDGAYLNDRRIHTSKAARLSDAVVSVGDYAVGVAAHQVNTALLAITAQLAARAERVRMFGSAAIDLAWLADGRTDACIRRLMRNAFQWKVINCMLAGRRGGR